MSERFRAWTRSKQLTARINGKGLGKVFGTIVNHGTHRLHERNYTDRSIFLILAVPSLTVV